MKRAVVFLAMLAMVIILTACSKPEVRKPSGEMDTARHHVEMGDRFAFKGDWESAHKEYQLALQLDPKYVPALVGEMVYFAQAGKQEEADAMREKAETNAKKDPDKFEYELGLIRYYAYLGGKNWIENSEKAFKKALELNSNDERLYFYMAWAYKKALMFSEAEKYYQKVIEMNGSLRGAADEEWKLCQKIVRARPGTPNGKKIALVTEITRADVAALFVEEMHLPELWQKRGIKKWETPQFMTPDQAARSGQQGPIMPTDIANHPLRSDIEAVIQLGIRGLEVAPDGKFYPDKKITRAEYAVMLEDILIKVLNEPQLATLYAGEAQSKFHDMRTEHWAYNAAVVVTSRQIMPADLEGNFHPMAPVAGVDALLVIRQMMDYLKIG